jgi:hypothetical protein
MKRPCRNASQTSIIKMRKLPAYRTGRHPIPLKTFNFNWMKNVRNCIVLLLLSFLLFSCNSDQIVLENDFFKYVISANGTNLKFIDKATGSDYLDSQADSKCAHILIDSVKYEVTSLAFEEEHLKMKFGDAGVSADVQVINEADRITLRVASVTGEIESLTFLNVPLKLEGQPYEPFGACVLSMNLFTHVRQLPPLQTNLWAKCYERFGLEGAEITLLGLPQQKILPVIRDVISNAKEIPFSDEGGAWALIKKEGYGSYLMNFGTLTEETVDEWIETCQRLGFNQIDSHGGGSFFEFGTFDLNKEKWPDGWDSFKRINARLHEAGISHIFHTYAFFIDKSSRYVTPVPNNDLGYVRTFTLAEPVNATDDEIVVKESTSNISTITGFHTENSVTLRIGEELIEFSGVTKSPPYKFTGLKRGANGTKISAHNVNETAYHMSERFGRFIPGPETELFDEMAQRHAEIVNNCKFDGIYLDAIDGSAVLGGEENFWYYGTKFIFEIAKRLERPVGMEMSSMSHHWWHYRSRWQAWDRPVRGYKRFIDIHLASIKASGLFLTDEILPYEWEHGRWPGHTPVIDKYAGVDKGQILLPLHLGWWGNQTWAPPQIEPTFSDDIEYLGCKMIGNNAGFSQLGGVDKKTLEEIPLFKQATEIIRQYEELRKSDYFVEEVKKLLRQPGKEFTLFQKEDGDWNFKPVAYDKHKIAGLEHPTARWTVTNKFENQPIKLRIEPLMSVKPYDDPSNITLTDHTNFADFVVESNAAGVSGKLVATEENTQNGEQSLLFSSKSTGESPREGSFINMEKTFSPLMDLNKNQALGVWVKGDGSGQILNLSVRSPIHISHGAHGDHFIKIDFTGWKYFELVEIESSKISDYIWPDDSHFYVYDSYRHTVQFGKVEKLQLWYNNLPSGKAVSTVIGPVKALAMVSGFIENPSVTIGEETVVFPVRMESGMYLEFFSKDNCKLYGSKGELLAEVKPEGTIPKLEMGKNEISLSGKGSNEVNTRLQVTVISEGGPLDIK